MLKGDAKTAYMREYMRRRRAGEAKIKPAAKFVGRGADELAKAKVLIQHLERELAKIRARRALSPDEASEPVLGRQAFDPPAISRPRCERGREGRGSEALERVEVRTSAADTLNIFY